VSILGKIPRYDQVMLMKGARLVVQPSLFEGWSTVLEDARALGKQVVASDFPVHIEQALPEAVYFRRNDSVDCASAIMKALGKPPLDSIAQSHHAERLTDFARTFLRIAEQAYASRRSRDNRTSGTSSRFLAGRDRG
jgi:glycosyltransferase involved in cell wall biosynthesis